MIEQSPTPRDAVTSRLKENFGAIFNGDGFRSGKSDGPLRKTDVLNEKELLARVTVLIGRLCQYQSDGDGTDDEGSRHSCICIKSEIASASLGSAVGISCTTRSRWPLAARHHPLSL